MDKFEHGGNIYRLNGIRHDFSISCNPLGIPNEVVKALCSHSDEYSRYPDPECTELRQALSKHLSVTPDMILCGNGSADLINRICAYIRPTKALVTAPSFTDYERCVTTFGGSTIKYPLDADTGFKIHADILDQITDEINIIFLCTPNNPTSVLIDQDLLIDIADRCENTGTYLVVDECFIPFTDEPSTIYALETHPHLLVLRAFTKLYSLAGIRLGHLVGNAQLLKSISPFGAEWSVSIPAQVCGIEALKQEPSWSIETKNFITKEKKFMIDSLEMLGLKVFPAAANFMLVQSKIPLFETLRDSGLLVRDCSNFDGLDEQYIRIGMLSHEANLELIREIRRIVNVKEED